MVPMGGKRLYFTLKKVSSTLSHTRMDVGFRCLDVVMEVVSKRLDVRNDFVHSLGCQMSWEEHCRLSANV